MKSMSLSPEHPSLSTTVPTLRRAAAATLRRASQVLQDLITLSHTPAQGTA